MQDHKHKLILRHIGATYNGVHAKLLNLTEQPYILRQDHNNDINLLWIKFLANGST